MAITLSLYMYGLRCFVQKKQPTSLGRRSPYIGKCAAFIRDLKANLMKLNRLFIRSRHKAGTTDGAQGRDDGWGERPGQRMEHKAGTTDGAQGRDDGWGTRPGRRMGRKAGTTDGAQGWDD